MLINHIFYFHYLKKINIRSKISKKLYEVKLAENYNNLIYIIYIYDLHKSNSINLLEIEIDGFKTPMWKKTPTLKKIYHKYLKNFFLILKNV